MEKIYQLYSKDDTTKVENISTYIGDAGLERAIKDFDMIKIAFDIVKLYEGDVSPWSGRVVEGKTIRLSIDGEEVEKKVAV